MAPARGQRLEWCEEGIKLSAQGSAGSIQALPLLESCVSGADAFPLGTLLQEKYGAVDEELWESRLQALLGRIRLRLGDPSLATRHLRASVLRLSSSPSSPSCAQALRQQSLGLALGMEGLALRLAHGDLHKVMELLQQGVSAARVRVRCQLPWWSPWWTQEDLRELFLNLGDVLTRLGEPATADQLYIEAKELGHLVHASQRPVHFTPNLQARPVWHAVDDPTIARAIEALEDSWVVIHEEGRAAMRRSKAGFFPANPELIHSSSLHNPWSQFFLFEHGAKDVKNCRVAPRTCKLVESLGARESMNGDAKFSLIQPGTQVHKHCGPTNARLRIHLGLDELGSKGAHLSVAGGHHLVWREGKCFCFDDSWEHTVHHNGTLPRLVFVFDLNHPDLPSEQRPRVPLSPPVTVMRNNPALYAPNPVIRALAVLMDGPSSLSAAVAAAVTGARPGVESSGSESPSDTLAICVLVALILSALYVKFILLPQLQRLRSTAQRFQEVLSQRRPSPRNSSIMEPASGAEAEGEEAAGAGAGAAAAGRKRKQKAKAKGE